MSGRIRARNSAVPTPFCHSGVCESVANTAVLARTSYPPKIHFFNDRQRAHTIPLRLSYPSGQRDHPVRHPSGVWTVPTSSAGLSRRAGPRTRRLGAGPDDGYLSGDDEHSDLRLIADEAESGESTDYESDASSEPDGPSDSEPDSDPPAQPAGDTLGAPTQWPTIPSPGAATAYPFRAPATAAEVAAAFGVASQRTGEEAATSRLRKLPDFNRPADTAPIVPTSMGTYVSPLGLTVPPVRVPRPGHLEDLYQHAVLVFDPKTDGKWVRRQVARQLQEARRDGRRATAADRVWSVAASSLADELVRWREANARDMAEAQSRAAARSRGEQPTRWRPTACPWLIHERHRASWSAGYVWELRFFWDWKSSGVGDGRIVPLRTNLCSAEVPCDCCYRQRRPHHWDTAWLATVAAASACPNRQQISMLCGQGSVMPYTGSMSTVLHTHSRSFFDEIETAIATASTEVAESYICGPHAGPPFEPTVTHGCGIALSVRGGKVKRRHIGNLTAAGELTEFSVNAGRDTSALHMEYITSAEFLAALHTVASSGSPVEIRKFDWANFYRQLLRAPCGWWLAVAMRLPGGFFVDERKIMGDGTCCFSGNDVESVLVFLVRHITMTDVWHFPPAPEDWLAALLAQRWAVGTVRQWILDRASAFGTPTADMSVADRMACLWNLVPAILAGYFDDTMTGGVPAVVEDITTAVFTLIQGLKIDSQYTKFERATTGPHYYVYAGTELALDPRGRVWAEDRDVHHLQILGKEVDLDSHIRRDSQPRLEYVRRLMEHIIADAARPASNGLVESVLIEKLLGNLVFITDTARVLRGLLNRTCACLKGHRGYAQRGPSRSSAILGFQAHGVEVAASVLSWPNNPTTFCRLTTAAIEEWEAIMLTLPRVNGEHWLPRRSGIGDRGVVFAMSDSAGYEANGVTGEFPPLPDHPLSGATWLYSHGWPQVEWMQELWNIEVLKRTHSTQQEFANGNAALREIIDRIARGADIVEVFDSQATVHIARRLATRKAGLIPLVEERFALIEQAAARSVRILTLWNGRDEGQIADDFSKSQWPAIRRALHGALPGIPVAAHAIPRGPNLLHRLHQTGDLPELPLWP